MRCYNVPVTIEYPDGNKIPGTCIDFTMSQAVGSTVCISKTDFTMIEREKVDRDTGSLTPAIYKRGVTAVREPHLEFTKRRDGTWKQKGSRSVIMHWNCTDINLVFK